MGEVPDQGEPASLQGTAQANALTTSKTFTTSDGVTITYRTVGEGDIKILCGNGLGCSPLFALPILKAIKRSQGGEKLGEAQLVTWDYRGLFDSTKGTEDLATPYLSIRDNANDALAVMDEIGWER